MHRFSNWYLTYPWRVQVLSVVPPAVISLLLSACRDSVEWGGYIVHRHRKRRTCMHVANAISKTTLSSSPCPEAPHPIGWIRMSFFLFFFCSARNYPWQSVSVLCVSLATSARKHALTCSVLLMPAIENKPLKDAMVQFADCKWDSFLMDSTQKGWKKRHAPQTPTPKGDKGFGSFVHYYGARKPWQNPAIPGRLSAGEMAAEETLFHRARTVYCARHFVQGLKVLSFRVTYTAVAGVAHVPLRFPRKRTTRSQNYTPTAVGKQKGETIIISSASPRGSSVTITVHRAGVPE